MKLQTVLILLLILGCDNQKPQKEQEPIHESTEKALISPEKAQDTIGIIITSDSIIETPIVDVKREMIMGVWTDGGSENASLSIDSDSIFYVDAFEIYHYKISADSIIIDFEDWTSKIKVTKLTEDSMIWKSDMGNHVFWKFED